MTDKEITTEEDRESGLNAEGWLATTGFHYFYESCRYDTEAAQNARYYGPDPESDCFFLDVATACQKIAKEFRKLADLYSRAPAGVIDFYSRMATEAAEEDD